MRVKYGSEDEMEEEVHWRVTNQDDHTPKPGRGEMASRVERNAFELLPGGGEG